MLARPALRVGAVLEATDFHPGRSGRDHLRMLGQAVETPDSRADEVLSLVELTGAAHRRVKGYSLGMRQWLELAAALLGDPELLILDEPANGLDAEGVRWLRDLGWSRAASRPSQCIRMHAVGSRVRKGACRAVGFWFSGKQQLDRESPAAAMQGREIDGLRSRGAGWVA